MQAMDVARDAVRPVPKAHCRNTGNIRAQLAWLCCPPASTKTWRDAWCGASHRPRGSTRVAMLSNPASHVPIGRPPAIDQVACIVDHVDHAIAVAITGFLVGACGEEHRRTRARWAGIDQPVHQPRGLDRIGVAAIRGYPERRRERTDACRTTPGTATRSRTHSTPPATSQGSRAHWPRAGFGSLRRCRAPATTSTHCAYAHAHDPTGPYFVCAGSECRAPRSNKP